MTSCCCRLIQPEKSRNRNASGGGSRSIDGSVTHMRIEFQSSQRSFSALCRRSRVRYSRPRAFREPALGRVSHTTGSRVTISSAVGDFRDKRIGTRERIATATTGNPWLISAGRNWKVG